MPARLYGGRWNSRGVRVVYASISLALTAVEMFVNLESNVQPKDLVSIEGEIPDELKIGRLDAKTLPSDWRRTRDVLRKLSEGCSEDELIDGYPRLTRDDIRAAIRYGADTWRSVQAR
ncbi:MAG: RES domain-containing protein [Candidatus Binataceae bacterium]